VIEHQNLPILRESTHSINICITLERTYTSHKMKKAETTHMFTLPTSTKQICALFSSVDTPISCVVVPGLD
jgi:hypothetical protein